MRKIEKEMLSAVNSGKNWKKANTEVRLFPDNSTRVFLHGNQIAVLWRGGVKFSLSGWNTPTTRSRLNAVLKDYGFRVVQRGSPYVLDLKNQKEHPIGTKGVYDIDDGVIAEAVYHE